MRGGFRGYGGGLRGGPVIRPGMPIYRRSIFGWWFSPLSLLWFVFPFAGIGFLVLVVLLRLLF